MVALKDQLLGSPPLDSQGCTAHLCSFSPPLTLQTSRRFLPFLTSTNLFAGLTSQVIFVLWFSSLASGPLQRLHSDFLHPSWDKQACIFALTLFKTSTQTCTRSNATFTAGMSDYSLLTACAFLNTYCVHTGLSLPGTSACVYNCKRIGAKCQSDADLVNLAPGLYSFTARCIYMALFRHRYAFSSSIRHNQIRLPDWSELNSY